MSLDSIIDKERPRLSPDMYLGQIVQAVSSSKSLHFAVVDMKGNLLGVINLNNIRKIIFRSELYRMYKAEQLMEHPATMLRTDESMTTIMNKFQQCDSGTLVVVNPDGTYEGFVSRTKLFSTYRQVLKDFSAE